MHYEYLESLGKTRLFIQHGHYDLPHFQRTFELHCVLVETLDVTVDGVTETLSTGELALILPNQVHSTKCDIPKAAWSWVCVFPDHYVPEFARFMEGKKSTGIKFTCDATVERIMSDFLLADDLFMQGDVQKYASYAAESLEDRMDGLAPKDKLRHTLTLQTFLTAVCANYLRQAELVPRVNPEKDLPFRLLNYIAERYLENITLRDAAQALGYNYSYLSRRQKHLLGTSFTLYVNRCRVDYAQKLLRETKMPAAEIVAASGFGSIRNYNHAFKAVTGKAPREMK